MSDNIKTIPIRLKCCGGIFKQVFEKEDYEYGGQARSRWNQINKHKLYEHHKLCRGINPQGHVENEPHNEEET